MILLVSIGGQLAEALEDRQARREDQRVLDEGAGAVGVVLQRQGELAGDDRADQHRLARAHGQRQDVAGVVERQRLVDALQPVALDEGRVVLELVPERRLALVQHEVLDRRRVQP